MSSSYYFALQEWPTVNLRPFKFIMNKASDSLRLIIIPEEWLKEFWNHSVVPWDHSVSQQVLVQATYATSLPRMSPQEIISLFWFLLVKVSWFNETPNASICFMLNPVSFTAFKFPLCLSWIWIIHLTKPTSVFVDLKYYWKPFFNILMVLPI